MAFRAGEAALNGYMRAKNYLIPKSFSSDEREAGENALDDIVHECGPVVEGYPTWHPLVSNHDDRNPVTYPSESCGYRGLDHTVYFVNGFVTCPYVDGEAVVESVANIAGHQCASVTAEELDVPLYSSGTAPILVRCEWDRVLDLENQIPKSLAIPLMLEKELPVWRWSQHAESWETMRPYLLGLPHGNRSSHFVSQDTAIAMKKLYMGMVESGMFGPF